MASGMLNDAGFRIADVATLVDIQRHVEDGGVSTVREDGVE